MAYHKSTHYIVAALMIAVSCSSSQKWNNELHESNFSEEKSPGQLPQHVEVDRRSTLTVYDCFDWRRVCWHYGKAGCSKDLYNGIRRKTLFGTGCQYWNTNKPNKHKSHHGLKFNYCRNPDGSDAPWCYADHPNRRWDYCFIDCKANDCFGSKRGCFHYGKTRCQKKYMYHGKRSHTFDGIECQKWSSKDPKYSYLANNYCSNPDGDKKGPWCFATKKIGNKDWDYCFTDCAGESCYDNTRRCFHYGKAECMKKYIYNGTRSYTFDGIKCKEWSQAPKHSYLAKNFCSNPDGGKGPWCYATKSIGDSDWDYCFIDCAAGDCYDSRRKCFHYGKAKCMKNYIYNGTRSYTFDGIKCKEWSKAPKHTHLAKNHCRNPDDGKAPWCYATKAIGDSDWDYCLIDCAGEDCFMHNGDRYCYSREEKCKSRYVYNGSRNFNIDQHRCEKWSSTTCDYKFLPGSFCRNPNKRDAPWCYTQGREGSWNYCFDEECDAGDCYDSSRNCFHYETADCKKEDSYTGTRDHTLDGTKCREWSGTRYKALYKNFCRNPGGSIEGPWCYTNVGFGYCFVGCNTDKCYDSSRDCFHGETAGCTAIYSYLGLKNHTQHGTKCEPWSQHGSLLPRNYCRHSKRGGRNLGPWCYVGGYKHIRKACFYDCIQKDINPGFSCGVYPKEIPCQNKATKCKDHNQPHHNIFYTGFCKPAKKRWYHCICLHHPGPRDEKRMIIL